MNGLWRLKALLECHTVHGYVWAQQEKHVFDESAMFKKRRDLALHGTGLERKRCDNSTSAHRKADQEGEFRQLWKNKTQQALWPLARSSLGEHKQRKWEKEVESAAAQVISSIVHLTLLLIVRSDKGSWQRWCCSIDCLVMGGDERVPVDRGGWCGWGWGAGSVNGTVRMFMQDVFGGEPRTKPKVQTLTHTHTHYLTHQACRNTHSHLSWSFAQS